MTKHFRIQEPSRDTQTRYFVECDYASGPMFRETPPVYTEAKCVDDIIEDQHTDVLRIFAANDVDGTWRNVTEDIARLISQSHRDWYSKDAVRLCKQFSLPDPSKLTDGYDGDELGGDDRNPVHEHQSDYRRAVGY